MRSEDVVGDLGRFVISEKGDDGSIGLAIPIRRFAVEFGRDIQCRR